jgi:hypothetical protein
MLIFGIDPGYSGAITLYWPATGVIEIYDMPTLTNAKGKQVLNQRAILDVLEPEGDGPRTAFIEHVSAMPNQGVTSVFRFGDAIRAVADGAGRNADAVSACHTGCLEAALWLDPRQGRQPRSGDAAVSRLRRQV